VKFKPIKKYCWIGFSFIVAGLLSLLSKYKFVGGSLLGVGLTVIILNLIGRLKK